MLQGVCVKAYCKQTMKERILYVQWFKVCMPLKRNNTFSSGDSRTSRNVGKPGSVNLITFKLRET